MHRFPNGKKNEERRRQWLANLERKNFNPGKSAMVCSIHFPDGRPTTMNPYPTEHLGKENKRVPHKGRRTVLKSAAKFTTKPSSAPAVNQGAGVSPVGPPPATTCCLGRRKHCRGFHHCHLTGDIQCAAPCRDHVLNLRLRLQEENHERAGRAVRHSCPRPHIQLDSCGRAP
ncbi:uncharacterized protein ISCGN_008843 [Ixodes scapularis]